MLDEEKLKKYVVFSKEVEDAKRENKPIVALESTIISHGMPYPKNLETALACERIVRENGAVPATTAIIDGKIRVGLSEEELKFMATSKDIIKTSTRDFPVIIANKKNGATTVATSILTAKLAGIKLLVTGGIGGVHRGAETTMDISRDLQELANDDVMVVCAGCKSILDIGLTLEYLETFGVPVLGYRTKEMPAFYTRKSGFELDYEISDVETIANIAKTKWDMGMKGGILVGNPIPEEDSLDKEKIDAAIETALADAEKQGVRGKESTPFLLERVLEVTEGKSLVANIALVENNAKIGAQIAKYLYK
jgi:pseudouridine-5'-phosphate glycosidase